MDTRDVSGSASWNKGRLMGQKLPLKPKEIWAIRFRLQLTLRYSTWGSTAGSAAATWWRCASVTLRKAIE